MGVGNLQRACVPSNLLNRANRALHHLWIRARVAERHGSAVGRDGVAAVDRDMPVGDEWAALAVMAEAESLQLPDDLEGERIVEFEHVHLVTAEARVGECEVGSASSDDAIRVSPGTPRQVP